MKTIERLPEAELEVMLTLWHNTPPLTVSEITKLLEPAHSWKTATVHVLLERLGERGFVACDKSGFKHLFTPIITEEEYRRGEEKPVRTVGITQGNGHVDYILTVDGSYPREEVSSVSITCSIPEDMLN